MKVHEILTWKKIGEGRDSHFLWLLAGTPSSVCYFQQTHLLFIYSQAKIGGLMLLTLQRAQDKQLSRHLCI